MDIWRFFSGHTESVSVVGREVSHVNWILNNSFSASFVDVATFLSLLLFKRQSRKKFNLKFNQTDFVAPQNDGDERCEHRVSEHQMRQRKLVSQILSPRFYRK